MYPLPPHMHSFPDYPHPLPEWCICYNWWTTLYIMITWSLYFTLGFILRVVHFMGLDKYVMTSIHRYRVMQCIFTALKIHHATPVHPPSTPYLLETSDLFTVFIVLSFPIHRIAITQIYCLFRLSYFHLVICI